MATMYCAKCSKWADVDEAYLLHPTCRTCKSVLG